MSLKCFCHNQLCRFVVKLNFFLLVKNETYILVDWSIGFVIQQISEEEDKTEKEEHVTKHYINYEENCGCGEKTAGFGEKATQEEGV